MKKAGCKVVPGFSRVFWEYVLISGTEYFSLTTIRVKIDPLRSFIIQCNMSLEGCSCQIVKSNAASLWVPEAEERKVLSWRFRKTGNAEAEDTWMNAENNKICQFIIVRGIGLYHIEIIKRETLFITSLWNLGNMK